MFSFTINRCFQFQLTPGLIRSDNLILSQRKQPILQLGYATETTDAEMGLLINLSPELQPRLEKSASGRGVSNDVFAIELLESELLRNNHYEELQTLLQSWIDEPVAVEAPSRVRMSQNIVLVLQLLQFTVTHRWQPGWPGCSVSDDISKQSMPDVTNVRFECHTRRQLACTFDRVFTGSRREDNK